MSGSRAPNNKPNREIRFARSSKKDARAIPTDERKKIADVLEKLAAGDRNNLDIKPIAELNKAWSRLRVGSYRVVFRETPDAIEVARVISRQELREAIRRMK